MDNLKSINLNKRIIKQKINAELKAGRIAGPFSSPPFPNFRLSPLGFVPKKEPNSFRLIHNLYYLEKYSLNDVTNKEDVNVIFSSFDD